MAYQSEDLVKECKQKLLEAKMDILNRSRANQETLKTATADKGGDETDQAVRNLAETEAVVTQERLRFQLQEIESALARISEGSYGLCEETEEPIEPERLKAIPWTRLSIEGAEIREAVQRRFAR